MLEFGYDFDAIYEAGRAEALVGGDWFDAFRLLDGSLVISVGDVAGSGLRAAITWRASGKRFEASLTFIPIRV
jgi:serine phosphatase RsbU (regulator of sigma subunit)